MELILYGTEGCHLCEQASALLEQAGVFDLVRYVDIAFDDALFHRYGVTIPVVSLVSDTRNDEHLSNNELELGWPFDLAELNDWLKQHGIN
uniref:glutaredoxin family protein n=1 Tax=Thaumasiovibrio occultus TaxID=1891184 RepID=UPI000B3543A5|nr:glutaredoxin family protein [Thaumasiovibrio occultus]